MLTFTIFNSVPCLCNSSKYFNCDKYTSHTIEDEYHPIYAFYVDVDGDLDRYHVVTATIIITIWYELLNQSQVHNCLLWCPSSDFSLQFHSSRTSGVVKKLTLMLRPNANGTDSGSNPHMRSGQCKSCCW